MSTVTYRRYEFVHTFRDRRFHLCARLPARPLLPDRGADRDEPISRHRISAPHYFMVGLAAFGTMVAVLSSGARIAAERFAGSTGDCESPRYRLEPTSGRR